LNIFTNAVNEAKKSGKVDVLRENAPVLLVDLCKHAKDLNEIIKQYYNGQKVSNGGLIWPNFNFNNLDSVIDELDKLNKYIESNLEEYPSDIKDYVYIVITNIGKSKINASDSELVSPCESDY